MIKREASSELIKLAARFKALAVIGTSQPGKTITSDYFKGLLFWNKISGQHGGTIIYGGDSFQKRSNGMLVVPWHRITDL